MTKRRDFKALVRERMNKTGERYTAARAQVLGKAIASPTRHSFPGVLPGYNAFGGIQSGTAALRNLLTSIGAVSPFDGAPYRESLVNGLCGGPGFLYAVFEYKGWPPLLSLALRSRSMPDVYIAEGVSRVGQTVTVSETTSPVVARKAPQAGRGLYADFLQDSARTLDAPQLANAAAAYREAGALWTAIADLVAHCDDATVRKVCTAAGTRLEDEDTGGDAPSRSCADRVRELQTIAAGCKLTKDAARALYAEIAAVVGRIEDAERAAVDHLKAAVAKQ